MVLLNIINQLMGFKCFITRKVYHLAHKLIDKIKGADG